METEIKKPTVQIKELPDKSTFYFYDIAKEVFNKTKGKKILIPDTILLLLYAQPDNPINGRISLMKQVFLLNNEILKNEDVQDGRFVKYYYGWYSFQVTNDVKNLEFLGYLSRKGKANTKLEQFQITEKGRAYISELFFSLSIDMQKMIMEKRKGWDQLGCDGILRYMYAKYPESIERSRLKEKYKPIRWGKAKG